MAINEIKKYKINEMNGNWVSRHALVIRALMIEKDLHPHPPATIFCVVVPVAERFGTECGSMRLNGRIISTNGKKTGDENTSNATVKYS